MGRGSGIDQAPVDSWARRGHESAAKALGVRSNPKRRAVPIPEPLIVLPRFIDAEGNTLSFLAGDHLLDHEIPTLQLPDGREIYPAAVPSERRKLTAALWHLWRQGRRYDGPRLADALFETGGDEDAGERVGTKALGAKGKDRPISRETLREEMAELMYRMRLPIIGFRLAESRSEVRDEVVQLKGRVTQMMSVGRRLGRLYDENDWWANPDPAAAVRVAGFGGEAVDEALQLMTARPYKARELAAKLALIDGRSWSDVTVRSLIHELRCAGVPIISHTHSGSVVASDRQELREYLLRHKERIDAVRDRASRLEEAGLFWFPESAEEREQAAVWASKPWVLGRSERAKQHDRQRAEAKERRSEAREEEKQLQREAAQARVDAAFHDPTYKAARWRVDNDLGPSAEDQRRVRNVADDQYFLRTGRQRRKRRKVGHQRRGDRGDQLVSSRSAASFGATPPWEQ